MAAVEDHQRGRGVFSAWRGNGDSLSVMYEGQRCDVQERLGGAALRSGSVILVPRQ